MENEIDKIQTLYDHLDFEHTPIEDRVVPNRHQRRHPPKGYYWCPNHKVFHTKNVGWNAH